MMGSKNLKESIKNILRPFKKLIVPVFEKIDEYLVKVAIKSFIISNIYYIFRSNFSWEHRAVLAGKKKYNDSLKNPIFNTSLLRRNIHRLEKGLLMKPRRVPFGLSYINETVNAFVVAVDAKTEIKELIWAKHVLNEYMKITPSNATVDLLRDLVEKSSAKIIEPDETNKKNIPYIRLEEDKANITCDELLKLAQYRRSVRWFKKQVVNRQIINNAVEIAGYSPTACNRQPYEFRIFDDIKLVSEIIKIPMGTVGFSHQVPAVAVVIGKLRNYFNERDRHLIYIDGSLAIMSFIYALEVQGIGSCCLNWPDVPKLEEKMAKLLDLELDERPIMLIAFGYPDDNGMVANSSKKHINKLVKYNFEETL